eukprot:6210340-Amphidinium_carterae.1
MLGDDVFSDDVHARVNADLLEDVGVHEEVRCDVGAVELVVLDVEVEHDMLIFEDDVPRNVDVIELDMLGDDVHALVNANVLEDVDVHKNILDDVGVVELVVALDMLIGVDVEVVEAHMNTIDEVEQKVQRARQLLVN